MIYNLQIELIMQTRNQHMDQNFNQPVEMNFVHVDNRFADNEIQKLDSGL